MRSRRLLDDPLLRLSSSEGILNYLRALPQAYIALRNRSSIGKVNSKETLEGLQHDIEARFAEFEAEEAKVSATALWGVMTWKDKLKWFVANKVFIWIGRDVREVRRKASIEDRTIEIPWWAEDEPKQIISVNTYVSLPHPVHTVEIKLCPETEPQ